MDSNYELKKTYTTNDSNVFKNQEIYEIELELINNKIGPGTKFNSPKLILESIKTVIKFILGGLQGTNYPISYSIQQNILNSYMSLIYKDNFDKFSNNRIENKNFIGPSSLTLQLENISEIDTNSTLPNIRNNYTVTEKADGERRLLFINETGDIYLISQNMNIIYTGAKTLNKDCFYSLIDGELITNNKNGKFINLYAAFDIYFYNKLNIRSYPFMQDEKEKEKNKSRYQLLKKLITELNPISINIEMPKNPEDTGLKNTLERYIGKKDLISPIRIEYKKFYPENSKTGNIFDSCKNILDKLYEYNTDGLIFTPAYYGVGANNIDHAGPLYKITWDQSFKWKPPKYNTIDFLVTTIKGTDNDDVIKPIYEDGINNNLNTQIEEYKIIQLRCSFSENKHGYINPCQNIIDDILPKFKSYEDKDNNDIIPQQFYPTKPYDPTAGICNIKLIKDDAGVKQMFTEENEVFVDNTIVEFSYDLDREKGWNWIPLRVRYDKTTELLQGIKNYGNAYHVANNNWQSIHNPITISMICTGLDIPDINIDEDIYYNKPSGKLQTNSLKDFHNLYVKKLLITTTSKPEDTLIDYACGKAGDLPKWTSAHLSFIFGIDISKDNLENRLDGACARFLNLRKKNRNMPYALFVHGNSAANIKSGNAMFNDKAIQTTKAIFGNGTKNEEQLGKGVARQYGKVEEGFNISSCQFALHYFLESPSILKEFLKNVSECTKLGGYFIGTAYDGKLLFNLLKKQKMGESIQIMKEDKKIWEVIKGYNADTFDDNSSSIGYRVDVYQESINQYISEYLINFDYLNRILVDYGFKIITKDEANILGLPDGTGLFSELFMNMAEEIKKNSFKEKDYGYSLKMSAQEKKISFLNRYFIYKKINNTKDVQIELEEYNEMDILRNKIDTEQAIEIGDEEIKKIKPKIRKLNQKLLLIPATEAVDELKIISEMPEEEEEIIIKPKKERKKRVTKAKLIIEDDEA